MSIQSIRPLPAMPPAMPAGMTPGSQNTGNVHVQPDAPRPAEVAAKLANAPADHPATGKAEESPTAPPPTPEALRQALTDFQNALKPVASELNFSVDDDSGRVVVKIIDSETSEVIKQIPSEEMLRISMALDKLQGLLLRQEA